MIALLFLNMIGAGTASSETGGNTPKQTVDMYFAALNRHDAAGIQNLTVGDGNLTALVNSKDGAAMKVRHMTWALFWEYFAKDSNRRKEVVSDHKITVDGDFAMAWGFYAYYVNDRFTHCGTNHIDLVRRDGRWKILNLTWTESQTGCKVR